MVTTAFARARQFLFYRAGAVWGALFAAVFSGILYVGFLFLLILFADLLVYRGSVPALDDLPPVPRETIRQELRRSSSGDLEIWQSRLVAIGLGPDVVGDEKFKELASTALKAGDDSDPKHAFVSDELRWRWRVHEYLTRNVGEGAGNRVAQQTAGIAKRFGAELALDREIPDCGVLGLIIRSHRRIYAPFGSWVASWNGWMWHYGLSVYLLGLFLAAIGLAVLRAAVMFLNKYLAAEAVTEAITRLRRAVYHHTYRLGVLAFRALGPTEAASVAIRHCEAVHDGLFTWLTVWFREPVKFALLLTFALMVNVWLTFAFVVFALLVWMIGGQIAYAFRQQGRRAAERVASQIALLQESMMMMRLVKVYLMERFNQNRVERQLSNIAKAQMTRFRGEAIYQSVLVLLGMLAALTLTYILGIVVLHGRLGTSGALVLATALVSLYHPVQTWLDHRRFIRRARRSARVLFEFLDRPSDVGQAVEAEFLPEMRDSLRFVDVSLKEPGTGRMLLQNVSLKVNAGQRIAIVGPDDMEKHALVYLIPRFLDPTSGEILIDGKNIRWVTLDSLRAQIAMVLQHNLVFNDTVANNIGCGDKSYTLPQIIEAAKIAHAHQFIEKLPRGYETMIGEQGHTLNIGQRFRVALARAILRDPALLIIEEPDVTLDDTTKDLLDDTMSRILPGRTAIFLPHRLSTIRHCDNVFLLFKGEIAASGTHKSLLQSNDLYRHLQYLEFNEYAALLSERPAVGAL